RQRAGNGRVRAEPGQQDRSLGGRRRTGGQHAGNDALSRLQGRVLLDADHNTPHTRAKTPPPPMWLACSRRESIHRAAKMGLGALAFAFVEPEQAAHWVQEYYDIIKSDQCVPISHTVNP